MTIKKHPVNGSIIISDIIGGYRVCRVFYGYTIKEAKRLFKEETREG